MDLNAVHFIALGQQTFKLTTIDREKEDLLASSTSIHHVVPPRLTAHSSCSAHG